MPKVKRTDVRKLIKLSRSVVVSLPAEDVDQLGWRPGQKVVVERKGRHLVVKDWKP